MPIIEGFAESTGRRSGGPLQGFKPTFVSGMEPKDPERTFLGTLGDAGVMALKGAVGLPQAVVGLADIPTGGRVGKALEEIGYRPEETQKILDTWYSDAQQAANAKVRQADGFVDTLSTALQNPSTILTTAGESIPQMLGGAGIARGILKVAPKLAPWKAAAAGEGILGAGAAASQIRAETEDGLLTPTQSAIAGASGLGTAVLGAAGAKLAGRLGLGDIDTALAQGSMGVGTKGLLRNVGGSALSEGVFEELPQSIQEQVWQNVALGKPWDEGVGNAAAMGMLAGGLMGGGFGALNNRAVEADLLRKKERDDAANMQYPQSELPEGYFDRINTDNEVGLGIVRPINPYDAAGYVSAFQEGQDTELGSPQGGLFGNAEGIEQINDPLIGGAPAPTPAPTPAPASKVFSAEDQDLIRMGVTPTPAKRTLWAEAKAAGLTQNELDTVGNELGKDYGEGKKALQSILVARNKPANAVAPVAPVAPTAPAPTVAPTPAGGLRVVKGTPPAAAPTPSVAQAPGVTSLPVLEAPADVQAPQAVEAEAQGEAPLAAAAAQGAAPAAESVTTEPTEPVVQRKRRVVNPAALQQSQAFVAPEPVAQEEAAADPTDETDWEDSKPDGAPALTALTPSLQQVWTEARAAKAQGRRVNLFKVAEDIVAEQGDEATDDDTLTTLNQIFGERDAAMLYDRYVDNMTEEAIANKYGLSRQAVAKVTGEGELGQKTRATKIRNAQTKYGWTDDYVQQLAARLTPAQAETEAAPTSGRTGVDLEATESAFGADTAPEMGGRDPSLREAGFSASASLGGSVSNWRDSGELAGRDNITQADQSKLDALYARRAAAEESGNESEMEAADAEISMVETKYLSVSEAAAKITQTSMDLRDRADKRRQQIEQARAAGKTEVSVSNKLVPVEQLEAEAEALTAKAQEALERAESVLQRGAVRKAKGAEPKVEKPKVRRVKKADAAAPAAPAAATTPAEVLTPTESAARAWDQAANTVPGAPKWADLPAPQQREFVGYGENNWTRQDVVAMMQRGAPDPKFGKAGAVKNGYTAAELIAEIKAFIRADVLGRKLVVVDTVGDLLTSKLPMRRAIGAQIALEGAYGVAADGTAYLIADRIKKGSGRAKFMHEVGGHIGLEGLLPQAVYDRLVDQIERWAKQDGSTQESKLAKDATERVNNAGTKPEDRRSELLAYFLEEAVEQGVDPTADVMRGSSPLLQWFRTLWAAFKTAVRRLGMKPETLSAKDIVNLAFGAARLEIAGTWHGTAAEVETLDKRKLPFRKFDHRKIGSGEGAQAYGWGSYLAQRFGVGKAYFEADVDRKTTTEDVNVTYDGKPAWHMQGAMQEALSQVTRAAIYLPKTASTKDALQAAIDEQVENVQLAEKLLEESLAWETTLGVAVAEANRSMVKHAKELLDALVGMDHSKLEIIRQEANTPEGSVMRVDVAVKPEELMTWEKPIDQQPRKVREVLSRVAKPTPHVNRKESIGHLYQRMAEMFTVNDLVENQSGDLEWVRRKDPDTYVLVETSLMIDGNQVDYIGNPKAASEWLDSMGVKGVTHTDAPSRDNQKVYQNYKKQRDLKAAFNSIPTDVRVKLQMRSPLDLAQDVEDALAAAAHGGRPWEAATYLERIVNSRGLTGAAADAVYEYADWLQDKTGNVIVFNDKNIFRVGARVAADKQRMRFGKDLREKLPAELQKPVGTITNVLNDTKNAALNTLTFTEDVVNRAISLGVGSAARLRTIYQERAALTGKLEREVERVADLYNRVPEAERGTGDRSVNKFLYDATREGKWGFKPSWRKGASANVKVDDDMKQRFDALSKESKALVEAVFKHGDEVLSLKKQTVISAADSEYDALIAEANKKNDAKKAASLTADKAAQLKRFNSLFELQEFKPYAPLKRFGNYVVIARSQKFIDADEKTQAKLENSGDDYHVSFAESAFAAREMVEQLRKQGAFAQVTFREREDVDPAMAGGALTAFNKLRATLDSELADAEPNEKAAIRAARKVIGELYLSTLAETSARKSEMRRRGVAGEIDMLRSFTTQGRADAQFIAGAKYNKQTLDAFNAMRQEVRKPGQGEAENTKSGAVNELLKRHAQSMEYDPSPITDKLARLTSVWFLATSPAYYLQNLTQPFMMSMPVMAGRFNYLKVGNALLKAYADLVPMFRKVRVGEQFDYASAPADVRAAISTLVDRQRIDIGMDTDLGTFRIEGEGRFKDGWNRVDRGIRNISQKMEAINRLATAIAAYRMDIAQTGDAKKALEYADSIITQTHGDYSRTNAPRAFNTAPGKIALQFRKFQLIQLTLLAKLIKNSFTGKEQAAARTALAFSLAHTAVMAGAIGLPGFAAISWALGAMMGGDDDEPFNLEQWLRDQTGNEQLATLLTRGAPAALGVDLSQKLGSGNVLSLLPFNDLDLSSRSGVESAAFAAFGGPAGGLTLRAIDGVNLMRDGQYYRGVEQLMPTGVTNAMKAYRIADEGVTRRNGDELMSPDEISGMESFWQAIGLQPTDQALRQFRDKVKRGADDKFQSKAEKIRNAFLRAKDDPDARAEARERWAALQDAREEAGYRRQPLSALMRAEQNQRERERNTLGGIQFNRDTRRFVEDLVTEDEE